MKEGVFDAGSLKRAPVVFHGSTTESASGGQELHPWTRVAVARWD
jgi:hypothetical protein